MTEVFSYSGNEVQIATEAALEMLLWSSGDITDEDGNCVGPTWDSRYDADDFPENQRENMRKMIDAFMEANLEDLVKGGYVARAFGEPSGIKQIGYDYVLTTGGHGAGFWDRGLGEVGDKLTEACKAERHEWYLSEASDWLNGEDGKVYCQELED